jgi:hypothetical protein
MFHGVVISNRPENAAMATKLSSPDQTLLAEATVNLVDVAGLLLRDEHGLPLPSRVIRFALVEHGSQRAWLSDAVAAVRYTLGDGGRIYPRAFFIPVASAGTAPKSLLSPLCLGSRALFYPAFRGHPPEIVGWAHRPEIGYYGGLTPSAEPYNFDDDYALELWQRQRGASGQP